MIKKGQKVRRPDIRGLLHDNKSVTENVMLSDDQEVWETPHTYEIWTTGEKPDFIVRLRKFNAPFVLIDGVWIS